jgi:hypothetical protein
MLLARFFAEDRGEKGDGRGDYADAQQPGVGFDKGFEAGGSSRVSGF